MNKNKLPKWINKILRNDAARRRYYMKRYGNLDKMIAKDEAFIAKMDEDSFYEEFKD